MTRRTLLVLLVVQSTLSAWATTVVAQGATTVELRREARVPGSQILLGDLAAVGSDASGLARVRVARAPQPGSVRVLTRREVEAALAAAGFARVALSGATEVRVEPEVAQLSGEALGVVARRFLAAELAAEEGALELELEPASPGAPAEVLVPVGRERSSLRARWQNERRPATLVGLVRLEVEVSADGEVRERITLGFRARRFTRAVFALRALARGESVEPQAIEQRRVELAPGARPLESCAEAVGRIVRRPLAAGSALTAADLEEPVVVRRGERLSVTIRKGGLTIVGEGVAARDGVRGETIPVQLRTKSEPLFARVLGVGRVECELERAAGGAK